MPIQTCTESFKKHLLRKQETVNIFEKAPAAITQCVRFLSTPSEGNCNGDVLLSATLQPELLQVFSQQKLQTNRGTDRSIFVVAKPLCPSLCCLC